MVKTYLTQMTAMTTQLLRRKSIQIKIKSTPANNGGLFLVRLIYSRNSSLARSAFLYWVASDEYQFGQEFDKKLFSSALKNLC